MPAPPPTSSGGSGGSGTHAAPRRSLWPSRRSRRHLPPHRRNRFYTRRMFQHGGIFTALLAGNLVADWGERQWGSTATSSPAAHAAETLLPSASGINPEKWLGDGATPPRYPPHSTKYEEYKKYSEFRPMNFPYRFGGSLNCSNTVGKPTECFETTAGGAGEELELYWDAHDPPIPYAERRWSFGGASTWQSKQGVDLIMRYPIDWTFCDSYILLPAENVWPAALRGFLYLMCLFYLFLGVAMISDIFMSAIEKITSEKPKIGPDGEPELTKDGEPVMVQTWNPTVANLTLLALGSSAPEIILSLLETIGGLGDVPGELGASTIVGSAAFNLLCISGVCMYAIPATIEGAKNVEQFGVFVITAFFSMFAYVWMIIVLRDEVVSWWEAFLTFAFFPILVIICYCQDRNWFREQKEAPVVEISTNAAIRTGSLQREIAEAKEMHKLQNGDDIDEGVIAGAVADKHRPQLNRGHYRCNATRMMIGKPAILPSSAQVAAHDRPTTPHAHHHDGTRGSSDVGFVQFDSPTYVCSEGDGELEIRIVRYKRAAGQIRVKYHAGDLTAIRTKHYNLSDGEVVFADGDSAPKVIRMGIIDNTERNAARTLTMSLTAFPEQATGMVPHAVITIEDDDLCGDPSFTEPFVVVAESTRTARIAVTREGGATGRLSVGYHTEDGEGQDSAQSGQDYEAQSGIVDFVNGEKTKYIDVPITDKLDYNQKTQHFFVVLDGAEIPASPRADEGNGPAVPASVEGQQQQNADASPIPGPKLGRLPRIRVDITEDKDHQAMVERIKGKVQDNLNVNKKIFGERWDQQFRDAFVIGGDETPGAVHYVMHFLTFLWKVIFAFVPPADMKGGVPCFFSALLMIGFITKMVEETATVLGCTLGIKKAVTAITFVALGTSLPDTFASKQAAEEEPHADAALVNVTGSNSVNVFLGIGFPWLIAAVYYENLGQKECFVYPAGDLVFSVLVFCILGATCLGTFFFLRLVMPQKAELGGPAKTPLAFFFITLWLIYILLSTMKVYDSPKDFGKSLGSSSCITCPSGGCPNKKILEQIAKGRLGPATCGVPAGCEDRL